MTPEERLNRIESLLHASAEQQVRQQEQLGKHAQEIDKQNEGIRSLIVVARSLLDSILELREGQAATDEKLNILVDTVDRIIRHRDDQK